MLIEISSAGQVLSEASERLRFIKAALTQTPAAEETHFAKWRELQGALADLRFTLYGDPARGGLDESRLPGIWGRVGGVAYGHWETTQLPTATFEESISIATSDLAAFRTRLQDYLSDLTDYEDQLRELGAPYTRGRGF